MLYLIVGGKEAIAAATSWAVADKHEHQPVSGALVVEFNGLIDELLLNIGVTTEDGDVKVSPKWLPGVDNKKILITGMYAPYNGVQDSDTWGWLNVRFA